MPKQGAVLCQQIETVVLQLVPKLKKSVPPPPPPYTHTHLGECMRRAVFHHLGTISLCIDTPQVLTLRQWGWEEAGAVSVN